MSARRRSGAAAPYRGPDRRRSTTRMGLRPSRLAWWTGYGAVAGLVVPLVVAAAVTGRTPNLDALALAVWSGSALSAGLLALCAWRVSGRGLPAHLGVAWVVLGVAPPVALWVVLHVAPPVRLVEISAVAVTVVTAVGCGRILRAGRAEDVQADLRPVRVLLLSGVAAVVATLVAVAYVPVSVDMPAAVALPAGVLAGTCVLVPATARRPDRALLAALLGVPALLLVATLSFVAAGTGARTLRLVAFGAASALVSATALGLLRWAFEVQRIRSLSAMASLAGYEDELSRDRRRRHDARSALAAIRAASASVLTGGADLHPARRSELAAAVRDELSRVERLLDPQDLAQPSAVDPATVLEPARTAWRARGLDVQGPEPGHPVVVDPDALRQIVGNLLDNAHRHGHATRVRMTACTETGQVHLALDDDGVGIPPDRAPAVFAAGISLDPRTAGSGLGLPSARALAEDSGGSLRLRESVTGASFVLTLPAATAPVPSPRADEDRAHVRNA